jgi:hypothetical protein
MKPFYRSVVAFWNDYAVRINILYFITSPTQTRMNNNAEESLTLMVI